VAKRLLLLSALTYGLFLLGLGTLQGELLALALPLIIYLGAALLYGPGELQLKASRTLSAERISHGMTVVVRLTVTNENSRLEEALIEDLVPPPLELVDGKPSLLASLPPGGKVELTYTVRGRRGEFDFEDVRVTASDHLSVFRRQTTISTPVRLTVLPKVLKLRRVAIRPLRTRAYAGPVPSRRGGAGVEFFGVREYRVGDPFRRINWQMSARYPRSIFTNEFEKERIADVGLILDARERSDIRSRGDALFEHAIHAAASLAEVFLRDGNRVGLLIYGHILDWTFPGYGKVQRERILRALANARTGKSLVFEHLDYLPTRFFPSRSQIVLISPLCEDDLPALVRLRARGYQVLVVSPDPVSFELKTLEPQPAARMAARIAYLERKLLLRRLPQAGIQVVDWQVTKPFDQVVHASLGRMPQWFRALGLEM